MLLKLRIRRYETANAYLIKQWMLDKELAQNVSIEQQYITGDFVTQTPGYFVAQAKMLADHFGLEVEIIPS